MPTRRDQDPTSRPEILARRPVRASGRLEPILVDSLRRPLGGGGTSPSLREPVELSATPATGADPSDRGDPVGRVAKLRGQPRLGKGAGSACATRDLRGASQACGHVGVARTLGIHADLRRWRLITTYPEAVRKVTAEQCGRGAGLRPERATVGWLLPRNHSEATRTGTYVRDSLGRR
jgi:hypothetical protein